MLQKKDIKRNLVENTVRINLRNYDSDEKRSIRRLLDTACHLTHSPVQMKIFEDIHAHFSEESSAYYEVVDKCFQNFNRDKLIQFGVNLGYGSWSKGAKLLSNHVKASDTILSWLVEIPVDDSNIDLFTASHLSNLFHKYTEYGVNSFLFETETMSEAFFNAFCSVVQQHPETAVFLRLPDILPHDEIMKQFFLLNNLLFLIPYGKKNSNAMSDWLLDEGHPFSYYLTMDNENCRAFSNDDFLREISEKESPLFITLRSPSLTEKNALLLKEDLLSLRKTCDIPVFAADSVEDVQAINMLIQEKRVATVIRTNPS